jgi:hypothetical protein
LNCPIILKGIAVHVVLLGDSIFDNQVYVKAHEPDVRQQLQTLVARSDKVTLLAVDGSVIQSVSAQIARIPNDATHLVLSVGGNDLLHVFYTLKTAPAKSVAEVIARINLLCSDFQKQYHNMLAALLQKKLPVILCTIYNPHFPLVAEQQFAVTGLRPFNDCILEEAITHGLPVIELRHVCNADDDYANPIEPSAKGGEKIARAIKLVLDTHDFSSHRTQVYK